MFLMRKAMIIFFIFLMLTGTLSSCESNTGEQINYSEKPILSQMKEYKIKYVGDVGGVNKLLGFLPQFDKNYRHNMISLQTDTYPYGLTIYYEPVESFTDVSMNNTEEMTTYAKYLFECIDNLGYVEYAYRITPSENKLDESKYVILLKVERPQ